MRRFATLPHPLRDLKQRIGALRKRDMCGRDRVEQFRLRMRVTGKVTRLVAAWDRPETAITFLISGDRKSRCRFRSTASIVLKTRLLTVASRVNCARSPASPAPGAPHVTAQKARCQPTFILSALRDVAARQRARFRTVGRRYSPVAPRCAARVSSRSSLRHEIAPMEPPADRSCPRRTVRRRPLRGVARAGARRSSAQSVCPGGRRRLVTPPQLAPGRSGLHAQTSKASRRQLVRVPAELRVMFMANCPLREVDISGYRMRPSLPYRQPCSQTTEPAQVHDASAVADRRACNLHLSSRHFFSLSAGQLAVRLPS